jgi:hypothetical protein
VCWWPIKFCFSFVSDLCWTLCSRCNIWYIFLIPKSLTKLVKCPPPKKKKDRITFTSRVKCEKHAIRKSTPNLNNLMKIWNGWGSYKFSFRRHLSLFDTRFQFRRRIVSRWIYACNSNCLNVVDIDQLLLKFVLRNCVRLLNFVCSEWDCVDFLEIL